MSLIIGGSLLAGVTFAWDQPLIAAGLLVAALSLTFVEGAYKLRRAAAVALEDSKAELRLLEVRAPQLSFGRAVIPERSQPISVFVPEMGGQPQGVGNGRVIRVPVINAHGAGEARQVHARLTFLPDDRDGQFSPRDQAQGEWFSETGGPEIEIDLPGNGRPRLLDVVVVLDRDYPYAHEWSTASRSAALRGYAISANPIDVDIEVLASGAAPDSPRLHDRLRIRLDEGMISADWASARRDEATNWVRWNRGGSQR